MPMSLWFQTVKSHNNEIIFIFILELFLKKYTIFIKKRQIKSLGFMSPPLPQETQSTETKYQGEILYAAQS